MSDNPISNSTSDLTGKTFGQYEIGQRLGQGGMATVYLGRQTSIGRTVAIKVMPAHFMGEPNFLQRFEREVKVIADLQHPRVLPVYDYGQLEGRPYIVMAYMPGGTVADRIRKGQMQMGEVTRIVSQIAEALDHAHNKGIIHRDFKPSNVLLDDQGNAYLADFGIAKISESNVQLTGSGIVGTPAYMAPEMAETGKVTPSVDIYALGITLFQMLTGQNPYQGDTPIRIMMAHAQAPVPDVREIRRTLPEAVANVVKTAMAKDPAARYATAGSLAVALRAAISRPAAEPEEGAKTEREPVHFPAPAQPPSPRPAAAPPADAPRAPLSVPTPAPSMTPTPIPMSVIPTTWIQVWLRAVTNPTVTTYELISARPDATFWNGAKWLFLANLIAYAVALGCQFLILLVSSGSSSSQSNSLGSALIVIACGVPIAAALSALGLAINAGLSHAVARALGGTGTFDRLAFVVAAYLTPLSLVAGFLSVIPIINLLVYAISFYALVLSVIAVKAVHQLDWGKAFLSSAVIWFGLLCLVAVCVIAILTLLGPAIGNVFSSIIGNIQSSP